MRLPAVAAGLALVLAGWQLQAVAPAGDEPARVPWWHCIVLAVTCWLAWMLVKAAASAHARLRPDERGWRRGLLAALPAVVLTLAGLHAWEVVVTGLRIPLVLLPPPSTIGVAFAGNLPVLWEDFVQTVVKAIIPGYLAGCGLGIGLAALAWRLPGARRALLPLGNFMSVMPIIGVAPIMVMWFGFDWQSKAAVVVLVTFFPMLVNALAGFEAAGRLERELLRTYAASRRAAFTKLVWPASLPFIFNGLKVCSTLALIGAIVAEFFGTPIVGIGFRISSEIGRMGLEMVWASIIVSALVGTCAYGALTLLERATTFWHPAWRTA